MSAGWRPRRASRRPMCSGPVSARSGHGSTLGATRLPTARSSPACATEQIQAPQQARPTDVHPQERQVAGAVDGFAGSRPPGAMRLGERHGAHFVHPSNKHVVHPPHHGLATVDHLMIRQVAGQQKLARPAGGKSRG